MDATINKRLCVACGMCADACPRCFRMGSDGRAEAFENITKEILDDALQTAQDCPVGAITISRSSS